MWKPVGVLRRKRKLEVVEADVSAVGEERGFEGVSMERQAQVRFYLACDENYLTYLTLPDLTYLRTLPPISYYVKDQHHYRYMYTHSTDIYFKSSFNYI